jgi:hypothetical protein
MRALLAMTLTASLAGVPALVRAEERLDARSILERAIKAHGGADKLARVQISSRSGEGVLSLGGEQRFKTKVVVRLPDRVRLNIHSEVGEIVTVINGDKGWERRPGGEVLAMRKQRLDELREAAYLWYLATLVPLQKGDFTLTAVPPIRLEREELVGLKVSAKDHADVLMLFDRETGLLARLSHRTSEEGVRVIKEYVYSEFKEFDGVKLPTREVMNTNSRKTTDVKFDSNKFLDKSDVGSFEKP